MYRKIYYYIEPLTNYLLNTIMKSKKNLLILSFLFIHLTAFSQQIGNGLASYISDFSSPLLSGVYNGINATGSTPDNNYSGLQHLLVIRHGNINNNHQLQIASSLESNDRLFFRKLSESSPVSQNLVWHELATRDGNTFNGNQSINGDLKIASYSPLLVLQRNTNVGGFIQGVQTKNLDNSDNWFFGNLGASNWIVSKGDFQNPKMTILDNGKVGIGTLNPDKELTVNGTIHSKEVIVDTAIPADYVFQKYYTGKSELKSDYVMPTLAEIENFTKKNHHLPNVPSAREIQQNGLSLGAMLNVLLQKIEELTLYAIEQQKKLEEQNEIIAKIAVRLVILEKK